MMVELLYEVWEDVDDEGRELALYLVAPQTDDLRRKISPKSLLVHQFYAPSYNSAMQRYFDWAGFGVYAPIPGAPDTVYSSSEMIEQQSYLQARNED